MKVHKIKDVQLVCPYCKTFGTHNFGPLKNHIEKIHPLVDPFVYEVTKD